MKPSNAINDFAGVLLEKSPHSKAIVLYSKVSEHLHAVARSGVGARTFARRLFVDFDATMPLPHRFPLQQIALMSDLQLAALSWMMQAAHLRGVGAEHGHARVRTLSQDQFLVRKADTLHALGGFFELSADKDFWESVVSGPVFGAHAKRPGEAFDADKQAALRAAHANEVDSVMQWAERYRASANVNIDLGDPLLG